MKVNELRDLSTAELEEKLAESKQELFNLRFQNAINQLENPKRIGDVKKTIARILTIIHERELQGSCDVMRYLFDRYKFEQIEDY